MYLFLLQLKESLLALIQFYILSTNRTQNVGIIHAPLRYPARLR